MAEQAPVNLADGVVLAAIGAPDDAKPSPAAPANPADGNDVNGNAVSAAPAAA